MRRGGVKLYENHADWGMCMPVRLACVGNTRSYDENTRILFRCNLFFEHIRLEYVHIHVRHSVNQAEYAIHIPTTGIHDCIPHLGL